MKLTKRKVAFIEANADKFEVVTTVYTKNGEKPERRDYDMERVCNVITAAPFFRSLGGREFATINSDYNGDNPLISIVVTSVSPDGKNFSRWQIFLSTDDVTHYKLTK
jgi:hypothetical protein